MKAGAKWPEGWATGQDRVLGAFRKDTAATGVTRPYALGRA
ncbi:hypothetical protein QNO09_03155 [Streptomyces sp. 378]|nr:hypothetical protein [Streptomyces sp. 378]MDK1342327.1 hypothetical protein [Streptomyces sp. 378]